jgi:hypothetical protein
MGLPSQPASDRSYLLISMIDPLADDSAIRGEPFKKGQKWPSPDLPDLGSQSQNSSVIVMGERVCVWTAARTGGRYFAGSGQGIGLERGGQLVAGVLYDNFTGHSVQMHVAAIGKNWMVRDYLRACFDYPFNQMKVNKVIGLVDSTNLDALRFDRHLGFVDEAVIKDAGKFGDLHILTMNRQQCRFI